MKLKKISIMIAAIISMAGAAYLLTLKNTAYIRFLRWNELISRLLSITKGGKAYISNSVIIVAAAFIIVFLITCSIGKIGKLTRALGHAVSWFIDQL